MLPARAQRQEERVALLHLGGIVTDIAVYADQIWSSDQGGSEREEWLQRLKNNFLPGHTIEVAYRLDRTAR